LGLFCWIVSLLLAETLRNFSGGRIKLHTATFDFYPEKEELFSSALGGDHEKTTNYGCCVRVCVNIRDGNDAH
jgi:hypothetical protein